LGQIHSKTKAFATTAKALFFKKGNKRKEFGRASTSWATHCFTSKAGLEPATRF
jgi:hypothetical protein